MERNFKDIKLTVPWGHVAAKTYGLENEKRMLLVHGTLDNAGSFDRLVQYLPEDYYIVCIDLPGHGFSSHFPGGTPLNFFNYVFAVSLVLDQLKWTNFIYIGHSLGAQIGVYYTSIYPRAVEKLILVDGLFPEAITNDILVPYMRKTFDSTKEHLEKKNPYLYTKDEVLYSLSCLRFSALNTAAASALFNRGVTKVGDLYKYNRDSRLKHFLRPPMTIRQHAVFWANIHKPILLIIASSTLRTLTTDTAIHGLDTIKKFSDLKIVTVNGNHDVHNNNPEKVAPHICQFLDNNFKSKL
ncbi:serine hydrolase-like protein 2 [Prorops nasuta]|uniref:serine hydrolase-like protein 2 n=1 Tax=Prorops nasuta TaxID=863751 RepID=UPI0034CF0FE5